MDEEQGYNLLDWKDDESTWSASIYPVVGKIISDEVLNSGEVISNIHKLWKNTIHEKVRITHVTKNRYLFQFDCASAAFNVVRDGPWIVMGHFLCLQHWETDTNLEDISLENVRIWVQIYGLTTLDLMSDPPIGKEIGNYIGTFLALGPGNLRCFLNHEYIRIRVRINCYKVIKSGMWVSSEAQGQCRVHFKYENMADLCYNCGHFGHSMSTCKNQAFPHPHFGPWLRADFKARDETDTDAQQPADWKLQDLTYEDWKEIATRVLVVLFLIFVVVFLWMVIPLPG